MSEHNFNKRERKAVWPIEGRRSTDLARAQKLLMEVSHLQVARLISKHGILTYERLDRTREARAFIIFGTKEEALKTAKRINRAHDIETTTDTGASYTANQPDLKSHVLNMRTMATVRAHEQLVQPLSQEEKDRYTRSIGKYGRMLGIPDRLLPETYEEVLSYYRVSLENGTISVGEHGLRIRDRILRPLENYAETAELIHPSTRPIGTVADQFVPIEYGNDLHEMVTAGLLPAELRQMYGIRPEWDEKDQRRFNAFAWCVRLGNRVPIRPITHISEFDQNALRM